MYKSKQGYYYIVGDFAESNKDDLLGQYGRFRKRFGDRNIIMLEQARHDNSECLVVIPEEGGSGKGEFEELCKMFVGEGFRVKGAPTSKNKMSRFSNFSSAAQNGLIHIVEDSFNNNKTLEAFYKELESFDGTRSTAHIKDDWVDAVSDAFNTLQKHKMYTAPSILPINAPTVLSGLSPIY